MTWQKGNKENPRKNPARIKERNKELAAILRDRLDKIKAEKLVVYALDECHLQGDEICGYLWGDKKKREIVKIDNYRARQTYYIVRKKILRSPKGSPVSALPHSTLFTKHIGLLYPDYSSSWFIFFSFVSLFGIFFDLGGPGYRPDPARTPDRIISTYSPVTELVWGISGIKFSLSPDKSMDIRSGKGTRNSGGNISIAN